jgi:hypothetical protein
MQNPNNSGEQIQVCKQFFLSKVDIGERLVSYTVNHRTIAGTAKPDIRGKRTPQNKTAENVSEAVFEFISSLPAVPSHYCRSQTSRKYLPTEMRSLAFVYRMYKKHLLFSVKYLIHSLTSAFIIQKKISA